MVVAQGANSSAVLNTLLEEDLLRKVDFYICGSPMWRGLSANSFAVLDEWL